jgi:hypothetical protein
MEDIEMNAINETTPARSAPVDRARIERVEALLTRYPALTDGEIHEIILFLKRGTALDNGLLTSIDGIKPQLDRFRAEHARALSIGTRELAIVGIVMLILLAVVALLWNAGANH